MKNDKIPNFKIGDIVMAIDVPSHLSSTYDMLYFRGRITGYSKIYDLYQVRNAPYSFRSTELILYHPHCPEYLKTKEK